MNRNRRTRERVRLIFWACLTLVCFLLVFVARQQQTASLERKLDAAGVQAYREHPDLQEALRHGGGSVPTPEQPKYRTDADVDVVACASRGSMK